MNPSIHRFTLDMHRSQSQISIPVRLGDTCREFRIVLSDGGNSYIIEDGCLAKLSIKRPSGTRIEDFCAVEDNTTIVYDFSQHENTAAVEGIHECDVSVYGLDGRLITTARFTMVVSERVIAVDDVVLTDEDFTAVDAMLLQEAHRQYEEKQRAEAEEVRVSAENERVSEEDNRKTQEVARQSAEETRISSEMVRQQAEDLRLASELDRSIAENERFVNEQIRVEKDKQRDASIKRALDASAIAEGKSASALRLANSATETVASIKQEFGTEVVVGGNGTVKSAVNFAVSTANDAKNQSDAVRTNLINLTAQVQGYGRTYVVSDFLYLIDFLNSRKSIELSEDRDGDGVNEKYYVYVSDLKSGDNILTVEKAVPDFWFEKNSAITSVETYTYNGKEYTLSATKDGVTIGCVRTLETDYSVIEGYSLSASASAKNSKDSATDAMEAATEAREAATEAREAEASIDKMIDELYFDQIAPPYDELENSVFLATPTYEML